MTDAYSTEARRSDGTFESPEARLARQKAEDAKRFKAACARQRRRRYNAANVIGLTVTAVLFYLSGGFQMLEPSSGLTATQVFTSLPALICGGIGTLAACVYLAVIAERDGDRAPGA